MTNTYSIHDYDYSEGYDHDEAMYELFLKRRRHELGLTELYRYFESSWEYNEDGEEDMYFFLSPLAPQEVWAFHDAIHEKLGAKYTDSWLVEQVARSTESYYRTQGKFVADACIEDEKFLVKWMMKPYAREHFFQAMEKVQGNFCDDDKQNFYIVLHEAFLIVSKKIHKDTIEFVDYVETH